MTSLESKELDSDLVEIAIKGCDNFSSLTHDEEDYEDGDSFLLSTEKPSELVAWFDITCEAEDIEDYDQKLGTVENGKYTCRIGYTFNLDPIPETVGDEIIFSASRPFYYIEGGKIKEIKEVKHDIFNDLAPSLTLTQDEDGHILQFEEA